jgi:cell division protein FtsW
MNRNDATVRSANPLEASAALASAVVLLCACGAVAVFSASAPLSMDAALPPHFLRHAAAIAVAAGVAGVASRVPLIVWRRLALPIWLVTVAALLMTLILGHTAGGATRWLQIPLLGAAVQPAEFAKWATVLAVAALLGRRDGHNEVDGPRLAVALGLATIPAALCLGQPDLGNAVILVSLCGLVLFVAGAQLRWLIGPAALGAVGIGVYSLLNPYAMRRWVGFLDPWSRATTEGFQLVQSFVAFGRGGLTGVGIGDGRQKLFYLPEAHTDFILSIVAEETGLVGVLIVLGAFVALAVAGGRIALASKRRFPFLLAFGMTALLVMPALLNAAVVMGLLPTKGLTLPFLSYGRSSLFASALAVGVLLRVAREEGTRAAAGGSSS